MITSVITAKPIFGTNPVGFAPIVPVNLGGNGFFMTQNKDVEFDYTDLTFDPLGQVPTTKNNFLIMVKAYFDTTYLPTILTDPAKNYDVEITINSVVLDFVPAVPGVTGRTIWDERAWKWFVKASMRINVV